MKTHLMKNIHSFRSSKSNILESACKTEVLKRMRYMCTAVEERLN
jgi:hypothetical protein